MPGCSRAAAGRSSPSVRAQTSASTRSGLPCPSKPLARHQAHLVFQFRQHAPMRHAPLLVERGDRLGPRRLAPRRPHGT
jgi:hypothetical protein